MLISLRDRAEENGRFAKAADYAAQLKLPPFPEELAYLWQYYRRLRGRKGGNGFSVSPIEWPDIQAFRDMTRKRIDPWEVEALEDIDDVFLKVRTGSKPVDDRPKKDNAEVAKQA